MKYTSEDFNLMADYGFLTMYQVEQAVLNGQDVFFGKYKCSVLHGEPVIIKKKRFNIQDYDSIFDYSINDFRLEKKS